MKVNASIWNGSLYLKEYETLFLDTIRPILAQISQGITVITSSTTSGYQTAQPYTPRYNNKTIGEYYGDLELYNYDTLQAFNRSTYPIGRFVNEFGFHSCPSIYSWSEVIPESELFFNSTYITSRNHHPHASSLAFPNPNAPQGQAQITNAIETYYPAVTLEDSKAAFAQQCWLSQVFQADHMKSQIHYYRIGSGRPERNLGSLVWQLNDVWQGMLSNYGWIFAESSPGHTWAAIEHNGRWKALQYVLRSVYEHIIVATIWDEHLERLMVYVVSDLTRDHVFGKISFQWYFWNGTLISSTTVDFLCGPLNSTLVFDRTGFGNILPDQIQPNQALLVITVDGQDYKHSDWFLPIPLKHASLEKPCIDLAVIDRSRISNPTFKVTVTGAIGIWVALEQPEGVKGYFSDSFFLLIPGHDKEVSFRVVADYTSGRWIEQVKVRSMWNSSDTCE